MLTVLADEWHPARLFRPGDAGGLWDFHPQFCRQNSDGTGAAAVGQPVGWVRDLSGNGNHLVQATSTAKPKLAGGPSHGLDFDGVDDKFDVFSSLAIRSVVLAVNQSDAAPAYIIDGRRLSDGAGGHFAYREQTNNTFAYNSAWDEVRVNGALTITNTLTWQGMAKFAFEFYDTNGSTIAFSPLQRYSQNEVFQGTCYAMLAIGRILSVSEKFQIRHWMARRAGITL